MGGSHTLSLGALAAAACLAVSGCALRVIDATPATLPRDPANTYTIEARVAASGYTVTSAAADVDGVSVPMSAVGGDLWRATAMLDPCKTGFTVSYAASGQGVFGATANDFEPEDGVLQKSIQGAAPMSCMPQIGAQFTVTSTADSPDLNPGNGACDSGGGVCTLRAAVMEANALAGPDRIILSAGPYPLTRVGEDDTAAAGDLDLIDEVVIESADGAVIDAAGLNDRLFEILPGVSATLRRLTLQNGLTQIGGGLANAGTLLIEGGAIRNNTALTRAGGIHNTGALTIREATIQGNITDLASGGGMQMDSGTAFIERTTFTENNSNQHGGAMSIIAGEVTLLNVTLSGNRADTYGGAIHANTGAFVRVRSSTITKNIADFDNSGLGGGPGAGGRGGGVLRGGGADGAFTLVNTILAGNQRFSGGGFPDDCTGASFESLGRNLIGTNAGCTITADLGLPDLGATGDPITNPPLNPQLGSLALSGPTAVHMPSGTSPVRDAGAEGAANDAGPLACPTVDQRGQARPVDGDGDGVARCDIGAVERQ